MRQFSVYSASVPWPFACSLSRYLLFNVFLGLSDACVLAHIQICLCVCVYYVSRNVLSYRYGYVIYML